MKVQTRRRGFTYKNDLILLLSKNLNKNQTQFSPTVRFRLAKMKSYHLKKIIQWNWANGSKVMSF